MSQAQTTLDEAAASEIFGQITDVVFSNLRRTLEINRLAPSHERDGTVYTRTEMYNKDPV